MIKGAGVERVDQVGFMTTREASDNICRLAPLNEDPKWRNIPLMLFLLDLQKGFCILVLSNEVD